MSLSILRMPCRAVEWSRRRTCSPIFTRLRPVHSRMRYIAMWRAVVSGRERLLERRGPPRTARSSGALSSGSSRRRSRPRPAAGGPRAPARRARSRSAVPRGRDARDDPEERALELADVLVELLAMKSMTSSGTWTDSPLRLQLQDRDPGLEVGWLNVDARVPSRNRTAGALPSRSSCGGRSDAMTICRSFRGGR